MAYRQIVLTGNRQLEIRQAPDLKVNGSPVIKVTHVGICGSDVHMWELGDQYRGVVPGHEYTGIVVDPGNTSLKEGDRVLGYTQNTYDEPCGRCDACLSGNFDGCTQRKVKVSIGSELEHPGAMQEYMSWFPSGFFKIPDSVTNEEAALIEPASVALHGVSVSTMMPGDNVLVLGGGIIGQCVAEWARMYGAGTITLTETNPNKIQRIKEIGIVDNVLDAKSPDLEDQLKAIAPDGFDQFFECVALAEPVNMAIRLLKRRATGVLLGVAFKPIPIDYYSTVIFHQRLQGSKGHIPRDFMGTLAAMQHGKLDLKKYISKKIKLEDLQSNLERMSKQPDDIKVLIEI